MNDPKRNLPRMVTFSRTGLETSFEFYETEPIQLNLLKSRMRYADMGRLQKDTVMSQLYAFFQDEAAATAIEYGLIAAGISVAIIAVVNGLGTQLNTVFSTVSSDLAAQ
jgi:pilus assembly protein Flp/PilA